MRKKPMLRLCALLLAAVFALGAAPAGASYAPSFSDVPDGEWYADYVSLCAGYGIINGYEDGTFRPDNSITRGAFAGILDRFLKFQTASPAGRFPTWTGTIGRTPS